MGSECPSRNHKRALLRGKSRFYGMETGVSEVELSLTPSLGPLRTKDRQ